MSPTKALKTYRGRGQIYSWLRAHHEAVAERLASQEATWPSLAAEMTTHRVTGRRGDPPSANAILKVWQRVCGDLRKVEVADAERRAAAAAKASRPGSVYPSRTSPDWRPKEMPPSAKPQQVVVPASAVTLPQPKPVSVPAVATSAPPRPPPQALSFGLEAPLSPDETISRALDKAAEMDWYLTGGPPKRREE